MEGMIDQTALAAEMVGISMVQHLLVIPHLHSIGINNKEDARSLIENQRDAAFDLAEVRDDVSAVSLYDLTDGVLFNGSPEANEWLASHGYDNFQYAGATIDLTGPPYYGGLLGLANIHPQDEISAAFFSTVLGDALIAGQCPMDGDNDGIVGFADVVWILSQWGPCNIDQEICENWDFDADGDVGFNDLMMVLAAWGPCLP